jgi:hypothetical protein
MFYLLLLLSRALLLLAVALHLLLAGAFLLLTGAFLLLAGAFLLLAVQLLLTILLRLPRALLLHLLLARSFLLGVPLYFLLTRAFLPVLIGRSPLLGTVRLRLILRPLGPAPVFFFRLFFCLFSVRLIILLRISGITDTEDQAQRCCCH